MRDTITSCTPCLEERIEGMQADIATAKENIPADKEQFTMKVGNKAYTDKKEAGAALVEMCKEIKITDYFRKYINKYDIDTYKNLSVYEGSKYDIMLAIKELKKFHIISKDNTHILTEPCGYCLPFSKRIFVNSSGKILVCEKVDEKCEHYVIGDVDKWIDYDKLNFLLEQTSQNIQKKCCDCWAIRFCNTCFMNESEMKENEKYCGNMRDKVKQEYKKYIELLQNEPELVSLFSKFSIE